MRSRIGLSLVRPGSQALRSALIVVLTCALVAAGFGALRAYSAILGSGPTAGGTPVDLDVDARYLNVVALEPSIEATFAITANGEIYGWSYGGNSSGFSSTSDQVLYPALVQGLSGVRVTQLAHGGGYMLAVDDKGSVYSWGGNWCGGSLGHGREDYYHDFPKVVEALDGVKIVQVAAIFGDIYCASLALSEDGAVYVWGNGDRDVSFGDGAIPASSVPLVMQALAGVKVVQLTAHYRHIVALAEDGTVYTWGDNSYGQLGDGTTSRSSMPVKVEALTGVKIIQISGGRFNTVALAEDGTVYTWGKNSEGQLGDGTTTDSPLPVAVQALSGVKIIQVDAGQNFMLALSDDGTAFSWGGNYFGQLGNGTTTSSFVPVPVTMPTGVRFSQINVGRTEAAAFAVAEDGTPYGWGMNNLNLIDGRLPDTSPSVLTPIRTAVSPAQVASVSFGGVNAPNFTQDGFDLQVVSPPHSAGVVDIVVTYVDGQSTTYPAAFVYGTAPVVTVHPQSVTVDQQFLDSLAPAVFTASASGDEVPMVAWQSSIDSGVTWVNVPGGTTTTLSIDSEDLIDGTWYRAVFTNLLGQAITNHAELEVTGTPPPDPAPAQVTLLNSRIGGGSTSGWSVSAANVNSQFNFNRDDVTNTGTVRPSRYMLSVTLPSGIAFIGLEQLDTVTPACVAAIGNPGSAPPQCWVKVTVAEQQNYVVAAGSHQVLRLSGATPADMPALPLTGGVGTHLFLLTATWLVAVGATAYLLRYRKAVIAHRQS